MGTSIFRGDGFNHGRTAVSCSVVYVIIIMFCSRSHRITFIYTLALPRFERIVLSMLMGSGLLVTGASIAKICLWSYALGSTDYFYQLSFIALAM
jgi:hypothetical protein